MDIDAEQIHEWLDDDLIEDVERVPDEAAEFNFVIRISGLFVHVVKREPGGPLIIGREIEFDDEIKERIRKLSDTEGSELVARIREALMETPLIYGFRDERGANVAFRDVHSVLLEYRLYAAEATQQSLMQGLIDVWKSLRYLDDTPSLIESVKN